MSLTRILFIAVLLLTSNAVSVYSMEIVEPKVGEVFSPGAKLRVVVRPAAGERILSVGIGFDELQFDGSLNAFVREYPIPNNANPGELEFKVEALTESKEIITATRKFSVALPSSVRLEGLEVDPAFLLLQMLPSGSDPKKTKIYETERIGVAGVYSDGYKRDIASSLLGTTYKSSDESIVTVDSEGLAIAKKVGRTKIVITNGGKEVSVNVIVKEKTR